MARPHGRSYRIQLSLPGRDRVGRRAEDAGAEPVPSGDVAPVDLGAGEPGDDLRAIRGGRAERLGHATGRAARARELVTGAPANVVGSPQSTLIEPSGVPLATVARWAVTVCRPDRSARPTRAGTGHVRRLHLARVGRAVDHVLHQDRREWRRSVERGARRLARCPTRGGVAGDVGEARGRATLRKHGVGHEQLTRSCPSASRAPAPEPPGAAAP